MAPPGMTNKPMMAGMSMITTFVLGIISCMLSTTLVRMPYRPHSPPRMLTVNTTKRVVIFFSLVKVVLITLNTVRGAMPATTHNVAEVISMVTPKLTFFRSNISIKPKARATANNSLIETPFWGGVPPDRLIKWHKIVTELLILLYPTRKELTSPPPLF